MNPPSVNFLSNYLSEITVRRPAERRLQSCWNNPSRQQHIHPEKFYLGDLELGGARKIIQLYILLSLKTKVLSARFLKSWICQNQTWREKQLILEFSLVSSLARPARLLIVRGEPGVAGCTAQTAGKTPGLNVFCITSPARRSLLSGVRNH